MDKNLLPERLYSYEAPLVNVLEIRSEGLLCGSYGDANEAGRELTESNVWDF